MVSAGDWAADEDMENVKISVVARTKGSRSIISQ